MGKRGDTRLQISTHRKNIKSNRQTKYILRTKKHGWSNVKKERKKNHQYPKERKEKKTGE